MTHRIALVEDNPALLASLKKSIETFPGFSVAAAFTAPDEAILSLPPLRPDVVLMDIRMAPVDGITCVSTLKPLMPETEFVMLTAFADSELVFGALAAGASGYLMKSVSTAELERSLREVLAGGVPMDGDIARKVIQSFRRPVPDGEKLTQREQDVLAMLAKGMLYKEIARALEIGYATVNSHVKQIYKKLQVNSRKDAIRHYRETQG